MTNLAHLALISALMGAPESLLVNGSFETSPSPGVWQKIPAGSAAIEGWIVGGVSVDLVGSYWQQGDALRSIDLDGTPGPGQVSQSFATVPGEWYEVALLMAGNPVCNPTAVKKLTLEASGQTTTLVFDVSGHSLANMGWEARHWCFMATSTATTLKIASASSGGYCGAAIDQVSVVHFVPATVADLNCDDAVSSLDLAILLGAWGQCEQCGACAGDLDGDCTVGNVDLAILLGSWTS